MTVCVCDEGFITDGLRPLFLKTPSSLDLELLHQHNSGVTHTDYPTCPSSSPTQRSDHQQLVHADTVTDTVTVTRTVAHYTETDSDQTSFTRRREMSWRL